MENTTFLFFQRLVPRDWDVLVSRRAPADRNTPGFLPSDVEILRNDAELARRLATGIRRFPPAAKHLLGDPQGRYAPLLDQLFPEVAKLPLKRLFTDADERLFLDLLAVARGDRNRYDRFRPTDGPFIAGSPWLKRFAAVTLEHSPRLLAEIRIDWAKTERNQLAGYLMIPERPMVDEHGNRRAPAEPRVVAMPRPRDDLLTPDILWALMARAIGEPEPPSPGFRPEHERLIRDNDIVAYVIEMVGQRYPEIYEPLREGSPHLFGVTHALAERSLVPTSIAQKLDEPATILWRRLSEARRARNPRPYFSPVDAQAFIDSPELLRNAREVVANNIELRYRLATDTNEAMDAIKAKLLVPNRRPNIRQCIDVLRLVRQTVTDYVNSEEGGRRSDAVANGNDDARSQQIIVKKLANAFAHFHPELTHAMFMARKTLQEELDADASVPASLPEIDPEMMNLIDACEVLAPPITQLAKDSYTMRCIANWDPRVRKVIDAWANYSNILVNPESPVPTPADSSRAPLARVGDMAHAR